MASLRDVLNHIGKKARLQRGDGSTAEGLALVRGGEGFTEPNLEPRPGDMLTVMDTNARYRVTESVAETVRDRIDHYKIRLVPI